MLSLACMGAAVPGYAGTAAAIPAEQVNVCSGSVVDQAGVPVIGATVLVKGTMNGTTTAADGTFTLSRVSAGNVLEVSCIGYKSVEIIFNGQALRVVLEEDSTLLDDVIVIGYGTVRKADLAGAVSVLDNKSFRDQPITQVSDALQGRVAGVLVTNSGIPGGDVKIRIRGAGSINRSNDPLYVVDGMVRESGLEGLNPEDIQSMQVLKDASSTAIYGSRGANGVILITTKTGRANQTQIVFDAQVGISQVAKRYDLMNAAEFAEAYNTYIPGTFSETDLSAFRNGSAGTDWQNEVFRTGVAQNYKLTVSGGSEKAQYMVSGNYLDHKGLVLNSDFKRYQFRTNVSADPVKWLHITAEMNGSRNVGHSAGFGAAKGNILNVAVNYAPVVNVFTADGGYDVDTYSALLSPNPVGYLTENTGERVSNIVNGRIDLRFNILPGLTFTTTNGVDYYDGKSYSFGSSRVDRGGNNSMGNYDTSRTLLQTTNNLTYLGNWGDHHLTATAVFEATQAETKYMEITGNKLLLESVGWWNYKLASNRDGDNAYTKWGLLSGVGRAIYNYKDKYLLTATFRADGSSKFINRKWGFFPSIAAAWTISNEEFMKGQDFVQDLKLRASYGHVGSQAISAYETLGLMQQASYGFGTTTNRTGYWLGTSVRTPDLTWEITKQFDLGLDFALLDRRLAVTIDFFNKNTVDGLLEKTIPNYQGGGKYWVNAAKINNHGVDLALDAAIISTADFRWNSTFTGSYIKNTVKDLGGDDFVAGSTPAVGLIPTDGVTRIEVGHPIGAFYGYIWKGLDASGHDSYEDLPNGDGVKDGVINSEDRTFIGKANPTFTLGWNNSISYKNWDFNAFFTGAFGASRLNLVRFCGTTSSGDYKFYAFREAIENNFDKLGQSARYPSVNVTDNNYQAASTKFLEKADYLRLDNLTVAYNLPKKVTGVAAFRLSLSCQNLFTLTSYTGMDPAGVSFMSKGVDANDGIDIGAYPLPRTITLGVRASF